MPRYVDFPYIFSTSPSQSNTDHQVKINASVNSKNCYYLTYQLSQPPEKFHRPWCYLFSGLFFLLQLPNVVLHDVGPKVPFEVGQLGRRLDVVLKRLLVDILVVEDDALDDALVKHLLVPFLNTDSIYQTLLGTIIVNVCEFLIDKIDSLIDREG